MEHFMTRTSSLRLSSTAAVVAVMSLVIPSSASIVSYTNHAAWSDAAGPATSIFFTEIEGPWVTDQYADLGVTFQNHVLWESFEVFPNDGVGLVANPDFTGFITMEFDAPRNSVGVDIVSPHKLFLYRGDELIGSSILSPHVPFLGVTSTEPFDRVIVASTGVSVIDNLYFGAPIPAPGALVVVAFAGLMRGRRRRG